MIQGGIFNDKKKNLFISVTYNINAETYSNDNIKTDIIPLFVTPSTNTHA